MNLRVLSTISDKIKGVKGMDSLDPEDVFVFMEVYEGDGFHMSGVPFSLDICFLDRDFGILDVSKMESETGKSKAPHGTIYAVEVSEGYLDKQGLKVGDCWESLHRHLRYNG